MQRTELVSQLPPAAARRAPTSSPRSLPLVERYQQLFKGIVADTPELVEAAQRLRYQVYCVENQFESPADNPDGLERDHYDSHSAHALLLHRQSGIPVGTLRMVMHKRGSAKGTLPLHSICRDPRLFRPGFLPLEVTAEISRFAISKKFRRRTEDGSYGVPYDLEELEFDARRVIPHMALGLITVGLQICLSFGIEYIVATMEPALLRLLSRFGIEFDDILGSPIEYHGVRQPCYGSIANVLARIQHECPEVWDVITDCGRLVAPKYRRKKVFLQSALSA